jgi:transcriptional regulator with XRE-family HTH domain
MGQVINVGLLKEIARQLRQLREKHNLSQEDVYNDTGINISRIESAKANISVSTLDALCKYYDLTLKEFFSRK